MRRRAGCGRRLGWAALAAAALGALLLRALPAHVRSATLLPALAPSHVAHHLADFSNQPDVTSWRVESDHSNYTTWSYAVTFECGARCGGRAAVWAHDEHEHARAPAHGPARRHHVRLERAACAPPPLLPWPPLCDEVEVSAVVSGSAEGARLQQHWSTHCSALGWLSGACARRLRAQHDAALLRLRATLAPRA